jgi:hypothetical protein
MAMQRHTGCHLPPREPERPAEHEAKPEPSRAVPAADPTRQPSEAQG